MIGSVFEQRRVELYSAGISKRLAENENHVLEKVPTVTCGTCESRASIEKRHPIVFKGQPSNIYKSYVRQAQALFAEVKNRSGFSIFPDDNRNRFLQPTIVKSRLITDRDAKGVLLPINRKHHWNALFQLPQSDRPFDEKDNKLIWRGVTTGLFHKALDTEEYSSRYYVAFLEKLKSGIDIKYTKIVQINEDTTDTPLDKIKSQIGDDLTIEEQLASKFILCLEGNDVATGLKWMMASNSTVLMPAPTCETWFCEGELEPWVHYVPVKSDLSDISEIYEWCLSNQAICKDIALNGKQYTRNFLNAAAEKRIIREVVNNYIENSDVNLDYSFSEILKQNYNYLTLLIKARKFLKTTDRWKNCVV